MNHTVRKQRYLWLISAIMLALVFIVSSCTTRRQAAKYGPPPTNYEEQK